MPLRAPRAHLVVTGQVMPIEEVTVSMSNDSKSDTFSASAPLWGLPDALDFNWWSTANNVDVQVYVDAGAGAGAQKLFDGMVDKADVDASKGKLRISGRDKSAKLIDKKSSTKHQNRKPHEIVKQMASDAGLEADVDEVDEKAGKIYQIDYAAIQHRASDWTAIQRLAEMHGRNAYTAAGKLYFKKPDEQLPIFRVTFTPPDPQTPADGNAIELKCSRSLTLGRPLKHTVHSWNKKQAKAVTATYTEDGEGDPIEWHHHHPDLNTDQANKRAKDLSDKTSKHEFDMSVDMPGDPTVTPRYLLELAGTGTAFDQQHAIASVEHTLSLKGGYRMAIRTKAKSKKRGKGHKAHNHRRPHHHGIRRGANGRFI